MKSLVLLLALFFSISALADPCYLPIGSSWVEVNDSNKKLRLDLPNDRNLYISYYDQKSEAGVDLAHKIYACDGKHLYVADEDQYMFLYAAMEEKGKSAIVLHFLDKYEQTKISVAFQRLF